MYENNLNSAIKTAVATEKDACQWQQSGSSGGGGSGPSAMNANAEVIGSLKCGPAVLDKVMRALREELEKQAKAAGVQVHDPTETVREGRLGGFGFAYTAGPVRGQLTAGVEKEGGAAEPSYKLKVRTDEKAP
jgi:hypothetical protein